MVEHVAGGTGPPGQRRAQPLLQCGSVEINWLPSRGIYIPGKIRDLSLERLQHRNETPRLRQRAGGNRCSYEIETIPRHWGGENDSQ
jgi:hypothetical protein